MDEKPSSITSVPCTHIAPTPQRGRKAAQIPSPTRGRAQSKDKFRTPHTHRTVATSTRPKEGRADQRSRSPPCHQTVDPFQRSERGPLSRNFAKKLAEGKNEAPSSQDQDAIVNKFEMEKTANSSASRTPIGSNRYGRMVRQPYRSVTYPTARRSDSDCTNELLHTILRNMNHLNEKVD